MERANGFEPSTYTLARYRSSQLSYARAPRESTTYGPGWGRVNALIETAPFLGTFAAIEVHRDVLPARNQA